MNRRPNRDNTCSSCHGSGDCDQCGGTLHVIHKFCKGTGYFTCRLCKGFGYIERDYDGRWVPAINMYNSGNYYPPGKERECFRCHGLKEEKCEKCNEGYFDCTRQHGENGRSCGNCNGTGIYVPRHLRWWVSSRYR